MISELVSNYEEVKQLLKGTKYEIYLDDEEDGSEGDSSASNNAANLQHPLSEQQQINS